MKSTCTFVFCNVTVGLLLVDFMHNYIFKIHRTTRGFSATAVLPLYWSYS